MSVAAGFVPAAVNAWEQRGEIYVQDHSFGYGHRKNRVAADEVRESCMSIALQLGGWVDTSAMKNDMQEQLAEECLPALGELLKEKPTPAIAVRI